MKKILALSLTISFALTGIVFAQTTTNTASGWATSTSSPSSQQNPGSIISSAQQQVKVLRQGMFTNIDTLRKEYASMIKMASSSQNRKAIRDELRDKIAGIRAEFKKKSDAIRDAAKANAAKLRMARKEKEAAERNAMKAARKAARRLRRATSTPETTSTHQ